METPEPAGAPQPRRVGGFTVRTWGLIAAGWLAISVVRALFDLVARSLVEAPPAPADPYLFGTYILDGALWTALTPLVSALSRRFPLEWGRLARNGAIHMALGSALVLAKMAVFLGVAGSLGLIRSAPPFWYALFAFAGQDLVVYWAAALATHVMHHARAVRERDVASARLETELAGAQLQTLKAQIQPHFLFNTLNAISTLVRDDPAEAERVVGYLSEMLRVTLAHHRAHEVTVREEMEMLAPYLEIERVRFGDRLTVEVAVEPGAQAACVPHLLLQPLVENAVRHGIGPRRQPGWIRVEVGVEGEWLRLAVEDNGRGFEGPPRRGAIGLENTRSRLRQLYGDAHRFAIRSTPDVGTRVEIDVPLRTDRAAT